jgi:hypothetical protein
LIDNNKNLKHFAPITRKQIEIGLDLLDDKKMKDPKDELVDLANACLKKDKDWRQYHKEKDFPHFLK